MDSEGTYLQDSWLFLVKSDGWFESESARDYFYSKHKAQKNILGSSDVISEISSNLATKNQLM